MNLNFKVLLSVCVLLLCLKVAVAGADNIASQFKTTASSSLNTEYGSSKVNDGQIGIMNKCEWVSGSSMTFWGQIDYPWIRLDCDSSKNISKIILYDRPDEKSHTAGGTLLFSDGSKISVTQIPNDGSPKVISFPSKRIKWFRFDVTDGDGLNLGLSEIEVFPSPEDYADPVSWVDPYIETTRGRYFFFITGGRPFGMVGAAPLTRNKNQYGGGYNYNSTEVLGFPQVHCWMLSGITLMPVAGATDPTKGERGWKSTFSHDDEIVQPGYHRLFLKDYHTWVELTSTERVSFYRFKYTRDDAASILLNLGGYLSTTTMTDAEVTKVSNTEIEGSVNTTGRLWGGPDNVRIYFVMKFDHPFDRLDGWVDSENLSDISKLKGKPGSTPRIAKGWSYHDSPTTGVKANYTVKAGENIQVKVAVSYTNIENARNNMDLECNHWDFDKVKQDSRDEWNQWLGRIDVKGGSDAQKIKFYTDLWHVLLGRHKLDDISGDYPDYTEGERSGTHTLNAKLKIRSLPKNDQGKVAFHMYNSDAFWLTQWNLNILWGLAWPEVLDEFAASLVQYSKNGGLLPRGPNAGGYSYIMTSCPATNLIVSAFQKGLLTKMDVNSSYQAMKSNHMPGGMMGMGLNPGDLQFYIDHGYIPSNAGITLECAFQDWSLSQMAKKLGKKNDSNYFLKRSSGWKKLFNDQQNLIFPKDKNGNWLHNDPLSGSGWVEANAWQATWSVSHDIKGLADLMGGNDTLCAKLNYAFEQAEPQDFVFGYGRGYVSYANQPGCSNAHVFNYAGKPWLSQYWVRKVNEQAYGAITPDKGYGGHDEDQGQMGGVSALMSLGLFSLRGTTEADPVYDITSPVFDEITIKLDPKYYPGKTFVIKTYNNSTENYYIQKAQMNGESWKKNWFYHRDFAKGGLLELWLGQAPNKDFGKTE